METKVVGIIQARMGSQRLPGKSLMPLGEKPLIDHIIERAVKAARLSTVVVAIPDTKENDVLAERLSGKSVELFRGSENDLVDRFYRAALHFQAQAVVRMCADNPLLHPGEVDRIVDFFLNNDFDFVSNVGPVMGNNYPDGLGAEVFSFQALEWIFKNVSDPVCREHVHENFYRNQDRFKLGTVACPAEFARPDIVLDINTRDEYEFISRLFDELQVVGQLIDIRQIIPWYEQHRNLMPGTYKRH